MREVSDLKLSISGIRAIVGKSLTPELIISFSEAFSTYISKGVVAVSSDTRPSRHFVKEAVISGLLSCGIKPVDSGILPIPSFLVYVKERKLDGGISITASHNPIEWNALKLIRKGGYYLFPHEAEELIDLYHQRRFKRIKENFKEVEKDFDSFSYHMRKLIDFADIDSIREKKLKVVVDSCNGAGSEYSKKFLEKLGVEVVAINNQPHKPFPRDPEPLAENLGELSKTVLKEKADIGFAQDADADRLAVVDENGNPIGEERTLSLAILSYLMFKKRSDVVVNYSTTSLVEEIAKEFGVEVLRAKVGEINVVEKMLKTGAMIGGEGNGGVIASDVHLTRDSFTGMVLLLELLAKTGKKVSQIVDELPKFFMIKEKYKLSWDKFLRLKEEIKKEYLGEMINTEDGIRVEGDGFFFHLRASNTEPAVRFILEARSKELLFKIKEKVSSKIKLYLEE